MKRPMALFLLHLFHSLRPYGFTLKIYHSVSFNADDAGIELKIIRIPVEDGCHTNLCLYFLSFSLTKLRKGQPKQRVIIHINKLASPLAPYPSLPYRYSHIYVYVYHICS